MKTNIACVCFVEDFNKAISKMISDHLDLYYADVNDYLEFNMVNASEVISKCGVDYLEKLENDCVSSVASFENALISIEPRLYIKQKNAQALAKSSVVVYIKLDKKIFENYTAKLKKNKKEELQALSIVFEDYDKLCVNNCDIVVEVKSLNEKFAFKQVLKHIKMYYSHG